MNETRPVVRRLSRIAPLMLVVALAASCGDDDNGTVTPNEPPPPSVTARNGDTTPRPVPTGLDTKGGKPSLTTATGSLLQLLDGNISPFAPTQVEGRSLRVIAVVGPDAFWAGRAPKRILVKMRLKGGAPPDVEVGQTVDFIGVLTATAGKATLGVRSDADRDLIAKQGAYVDASVGDVKLR
jgi:hypothetical protein